MKPESSPRDARAAATSTLHAWLTTVGGAHAFAALAGLWRDAAVFAVDAERNLVFVSEGAERLLGLSRQELLGQHCLKASRCAECLAGCGMQERGAVDGVELTLYRADGTSLRVQKFAQSLTDEQGRFLGGVECLLPLPAAGRLPPALPVAPVPASVEGTGFHGIRSDDPVMHQLFATVRNVARTDATVLVRGESGSGKELLARAIHLESLRHAGPFLAVNCAAMTPTLLESELFGHEKGAFTGATHLHSGVFERAHQGTLFLDEVAELPLELQAKLLRVLEERRFYRVGGTKAITVDVRIISATHRSLREEVRRGRFRADLMYRFRVVPLFLPPLRARPGDVALLVEHFIRLLNGRGLRRIHRVADDAMVALTRYEWPGNVRELRNVLEYAFAVGVGETLSLVDLPAEISHVEEARAPAAHVSAPRADAAPRVGHWRRLAEDEERRQIVEALAQAQGNLGLAAELLGMSRPTLWRKRKKLGL